jgi:virulence-associated protein VagC
MKLQVTEQGVIIPKELLANSSEVEITKENGKLIITMIEPEISVQKATEYVLKKNQELYQHLA